MSKHYTEIIRDLKLESDTETHLKKVLWDKVRDQDPPEGP